MNKKKVIKGVIIAFFGFMAPLLAYLSFPGFTKNGIGWIALIEFIPFFFILDTLSPLFAVLYSAMYGAVFYGLAAFGMSIYGSGTFLGCAIGYWGQILCGCFCYTLCGAIVKLFMKKTKTWWPFYSGITFAVLSCITNGNWVLANPFFNPVTAFWQMPLLLQTADIWGLEGITFILVFCQAVLYQTFKKNITKNKETTRHLFIERIFCVVLAVFVIVYGIISMNVWENKPSTGTVNIAAIQHNGINGRYEYADRNLNVATKLIDEAVATNPDLIILAENVCFTPVPAIERNNLFMDESSDAYESIYGREYRTLRNAASNYGIPLVASGLDIFSDTPITEEFIMEKKSPDDLKVYASSYVITGNGIEGITYKKGLAPFAEKFPKFVEQFMPTGTKFYSGDNHLIEINGVKYGFIICFEGQLPSIAAELTKEGAQVLVNQGSTYSDRDGSYSINHAATTVARAIENRRTLIRCYNSGYSMWTSPTGKIINSLDMGKSTFGVQEISLYNEMTFYTLHPEAFSIIFFIVFFAGLGYVGLFKTENKRQKILCGIWYLGFAYIFLSCYFDLGWNFAIATLLMPVVAIIIALSINQNPSPKSVSGLILHDVLWCIGGLLFAIVFLLIMGATIGSIPVKNAVSALNPINVQGTVCGTWSSVETLETNISKSSISSDVKSTRTDVRGFRDDGKFAMNISYRNSGDWMLDNNFDGEWTLNDNTLHIEAFSNQSGEYINEEYQMEIVMVNDKEYLVLHGKDAVLTYQRVF